MYNFIRYICTILYGIYMYMYAVYLPDVYKHIRIPKSHIRSWPILYTLLQQS